MLSYLKNYLFVIVVVVSLFGCAGSPVHTSSLSPNELTKISDYTLCHGAHPFNNFKPHQNVINEVKKRKLDCSVIYTTPLPRNSKIDIAIHSMKLNETWIWCKDSTGCVEAINWMKKNIISGEDSIVTKNYQVTLEKAINYYKGSITSLIGSGLTKSQKPYKLDFNNGVFIATELTTEQAKDLDLKDKLVFHRLRAPIYVNK